jgi:hypothetical protein
MNNYSMKKDEKSKNYEETVAKILLFNIDPVGYTWALAFELYYIEDTDNT